jgi:hypothetical protein
MAAIWHQSAYPPIFHPPPMFSFRDVAEIVAPAPEDYAEARASMQAWERKMGAAWYQHNANLAHAFWEMKKPWWLSL